MALAQEPLGYQYWFDQSKTSVFTGSTTAGTVRMELDVSQLPMGLHTFNYQILSSAKGASIVHTSYFYKGDYSKRNYTVWLDGKTVETRDLQAGDSVVSLNLDASVLPLGLHSLVVMATDEERNSAQAIKTLFLKTPLANKKKTLTFIVDGKTFETRDLQAGESVVSFNLNASALPLGLHSLVVMATDEEGNKAQAAKSLFLKTPLTKEKMTLTFIVDGKTTEIHDVAAGETSVKFDVNTDSLALGLHSLVALFTDGAGTCTHVSQAFFTKVSANLNLDSLEIYYTVDNGVGKCGKCTVTDSLAYAELDMSSLEEGEHTITFFVTNGDGYVSETMSATFTKVKDSASGVDGVLIYSPDNDSNNVYNLGGVLVSKNGTRGLPKGIYIQGKRKIIVK